MTEDELGKIVGAMPPPRPRVARTFRVGEVVRIISGPFASFTGRVEGINRAKGLLKVSVRMLGAAQSVKVRFADIEKG
jgi:transcriptional antiterminator NusG